MLLFRLSLLPAFVSRRLTVAKVGLFLHTPFPSSEIFRTLSMRNELLRGILSADQVGFHLFEYARHFLTTCRRLLGVRYDFDARGAVLSVDGRDVVLSCIHAGIEPYALCRVAATRQGEDALDCLKRSLASEACAAAERRAATAQAGDASSPFSKRTRVIAGIDKLERLRGLPLKLLAYEHFLDARAADCESAVDERVVLVQYVLTSAERTTDSESTRRECDILVKRIVAKHGAECVAWREVSDVPIVDRLALLALADVFWVSSVRDGLNRWPLEYVAMQQHALLGCEVHERYDEETEQTASEEAATTRARFVRRAYFEDMLRRMVTACGGGGFPCADPCTFFSTKKHRFKQNHREKKNTNTADGDASSSGNKGDCEFDNDDDDDDGLAHEVFPEVRPCLTQEDRDDDCDFERACLAAKADAPSALAARQYLQLERSVAQTRRARATLRAYLALSPDCAHLHAQRRARCAHRRVGGLLLSENASAARVLLGAVAKNPWRIESCAKALTELLAMRGRERLARHAKDCEFLARCTTAKWAYRVLHDLKAVRKDENRAERRRARTHTRCKNKKSP